MNLTAAQWRRISPLLPKPRLRPDGRGRPWRDPRDVLNGILWVMRTGAPWHDLPPRYPAYQTCHRRLLLWARNGTLAQVLNDLVGGHIDLALVASAVATPQVKSGNLKAFATTSPKREAAFPDVPTFGELGYKMMERPFWHALFAPAGTPPAILQKLNAALRETLADPKVRKAYAETGVEAFPDAQSSVEAAHAYVREEMGFWGKAVRDNNVKVD